MSGPAAGTGEPEEDVEIIGHRGYAARFPENTMASLRAAIEVGADAVEFDLRTSADGTAVLFHDETLERTTDARGPVAARSAAALRALDAGSWLSDAFAGEPLPTLSEALDLLSGWGGRIYAEIKEAPDAAAIDGVVAEAVRTGVLGRTVFIAIDWGVLDRIRHLGDEHWIGYIVEAPSRAIEALDRASGDPYALVDFGAPILLDDPSLADAATRAGTPLATWTVDDATTAARLLDLGVRRITTNEVEALVAWRQAL